MSMVEDDLHNRQILERVIKHNISYDDCVADPSILNYGDIDLYKELYQIILDTAASSSRTIMIGGERKPVQIVRERYLELTLSDLEYVMQALSEQTGEVHNIRGYLQTALFNARTTINHFFARKVAHDFNNSG